MSNENTPLSLEEVIAKTTQGIAERMRSIAATAAPPVPRAADPIRPDAAE